MKADAIIFDKDGTLIDFDAFWVSVSVKAINDLLVTFQKQEVPVCEILEPLGVHGGVTDIDGVLCKGTYELMGRVVYDVLRMYGCSASCAEVTKVATEAFNKSADAGKVIPTCPDLPNVLTQLKSQGKKLAVVTTDNLQITSKCLKELGIEELFDKIYTDDGSTPLKPHPYCAKDFADFCKSDSIVMVGDTQTDVTFAKNAGIPMIALAKTDKSRALLSPVADAVIRSLSELSDIIE